jgi:DNA-binding protein H-NS
VKVNLEVLSLADLTDLNKRVEVAIVAATEREKVALKAEMQALAAKRGLSLSEILGGKPSPRKVVNLTPWRDKKTGATWAGRGRYPPNFDKSRAAPLR